MLPPAGFRAGLYSCLELRECGPITVSLVPSQLLRPVETDTKTFYISRAILLKHSKNTLLFFLENNKSTTPHLPLHLLYSVLQRNNQPIRFIQLQHFGGRLNLLSKLLQNLGRKQDCSRAASATLNIIVQECFLLSQHFFFPLQGPLPSVCGHLSFTL